MALIQRCLLKVRLGRESVRRDNINNLEGRKMKRTISLVLILVLGMVTELAKADFTFGEPTNLGPNVNSSFDDAGPCISADGLKLYFSSNRPGGFGGYDLRVASRETTDDDWGDSVNLGSPANSQYSYWDPSISTDGLTLYFSDGHAPNFLNHLPGSLGGQGDIWMVTRPTLDDAWGAPVNIGSAVNSQHAIHPSISADGLSLYFESHRPGSLGACDTMVARRESTDDPFRSPVFLKNVNSGAGDWAPDISADGCTLFFNRTSAPRGDIWVATRKKEDDDFGSPVRLPPQVNFPSCSNYFPNLSSDGSTLYFASNFPSVSGDWELCQVSISPVVDFNGDEVIDLQDIVIMTEHWGENYPLCDIGPTPFGDGIVDIQDLVVLTEYIGPIDSTLIAHWALDEAEGAVAYDSAGVNDGILNGGPLWQPTTGQIDGALVFDGTDDYISTLFVLNSEDGPFSVFAWIKGGAPGQAVLSQIGGVNWLRADTLEGNLMTELTNSGRSSVGPMLSQANITDGNWHRIGFVWDGSYRHLYVDGVEVAKDAAPLSALEGSDGGLYFGVGSTLAAGTFFSGLIDDVRIYNRAVSP